MKESTTQRLTLLVLAVVAVSAVAGVASAATVSYADGDVLVNETVAIDNQTTDVWIEIENASTSSALNASVYGVNTTDNTTTETLLASKNMTASGSNATDLAEFSVDPLTYDSARVEVVGPNGSSVERVDVGTVERLGGGSGGGAGGGISLTQNQLIGLGVGILVLLGVGWGVIES